MEGQATGTDVMGADGGRCTGEPPSAGAGRSLSATGPSRVGGAAR